MALILFSELMLKVNSFFFKYCGLENIIFVILVRLYILGRFPVFLQEGNIQFLFTLKESLATCNSITDFSRKHANITCSQTKLKVRSHFSQWIRAYIILHNRFYSKACKDNLQVKEKVKLQCKKSEAGLLMENSHLFRTRVENSKLLSRAKRLEDCHSGEQLVCLLLWFLLRWNLEMPSISLISICPSS